MLLAGPSGCGKTHLALQAGLPIVALDDFYREGTEPGLPRTPEGVVDWEDPATWDGDAAVAALAELCRGDSIEAPTYAFGEDRVVGHRTIERNASPIIIAEGIFAAELIAPLRERGLLADALLVHQHRSVTFIRRLLRDLRDARKPAGYLFRQGWAKTRAEREVVARQIALGARPVDKPTALRRLAELASVPVARDERAAPPDADDRLTA